MQHPSASVPRRPRPPVRPAEQGIIVLGPLIVITVTIVVLVLAGKLLYRNRWHYEVPLAEREQRRAARPVGTAP